MIFQDEIKEVKMNQEYNEKRKYRTLNRKQETIQKDKILNKDTLDKRKNRTLNRFNKEHEREIEFFGVEALFFF